MAIATIKTTYSLDPDTVHRLDALAKTWQVSRSEALRRIVREAAAELPATTSDAARALAELRASLALTAEAADAWTAELRRERQAGSVRREGRHR